MFYAPSQCEARGNGKTLQSLIEASAPAQMYQTPHQLVRPLRKARSLGRRSRELGPGAFVLFARVFAHLLSAKLALRLIPVARILARKQRQVAHVGGLSGGEQAELRARIRHAILVVSRYSPVRFVCFPQCLAAAALLRGRGVESRLHYGITRDPAGRLHTHTWLESGGEIIIGGKAAANFSTLAIY